MKKLTTASIALVCVATFLVAAQAVTSKNIVGYNKTVLKGGLQLLGTSFIKTNATPDTIFGDRLPLGSKVYFYNGVGYNIAEYFQSPVTGNRGWDNSFDIGQGEAYWVEVPAGTMTNLLSGEVETADAVTNTVATGLQLFAFPYPVEMTPQTLGFAPTIGDKIYYYNGTGYNIAKYILGVTGITAWNNDFTIPVGMGFWYESHASSNTLWIAERPFDVD